MAQKPSHADLKKPESDMSTQYWVDSFDFFQSENEVASLEALRTKALEKQFQNLRIIKKLLDSLVIAKDRNRLLETIIALARRNSCINEETQHLPKDPLCTEIQNLWMGHLDSILFYEESAAKLEKTRRLLAANECAPALSLIKELELKEGPFFKLSEMAHTAYSCLGDDGNRVAKQNEMQKLRVFINYSL